MLTQEVICGYLQNFYYLFVLTKIAFDCIRDIYRNNSGHNNISIGVGTWICLLLGLGHVAVWSVKLS